MFMHKLHLRCLVWTWRLSRKCRQVQEAPSTVQGMGHDYAEKSRDHKSLPFDSIFFTVETPWKDTRFTLVIDGALSSLSHPLALNAEFQHVLVESLSLCWRLFCFGALFGSSLPSSDLRFVRRVISPNSSSGHTGVGRCLALCYWLPASCCFGDVILLQFPRHEFCSCERKSW